MGSALNTETTITDDSEFEEDENIGDASSIARNRREEISNTEDLWKTSFQIEIILPLCTVFFTNSEFQLYALSPAS